LDGFKVLILDSSLDKNWMSFENGSSFIEFDLNKIPKKLLREGGSIV
jgi:hypothetical protein